MTHQLPSCFPGNLRKIVYRTGITFYVRKHDLNIENISKHTILRVPNKEFQRTMFQSLGLSEKNTWDFLQNFSFRLFFRNHVRSEEDPI